MTSILKIGMEYKPDSVTNHLDDCKCDNMNDAKLYHYQLSKSIHDLNDSLMFFVYDKIYDSAYKILDILEKCPNMLSECIISSNLVSTILEIISSNDHNCHGIFLELIKAISQYSIECLDHLTQMDIFHRIISIIPSLSDKDKLDSISLIHYIYFKNKKGPIKINITNVEFEQILENTRSLQTSNDVSVLLRFCDDLINYNQINSDIAYSCFCIYLICIARYNNTENYLQFTKCLKYIKRLIFREPIIGIEQLFYFGLEIEFPERFKLFSITKDPKFLNFFFSFYNEISPLIELKYREKLFMPLNNILDILQNFHDFQNSEVISMLILLYANLIINTSLKISTNKSILDFISNQSTKPNTFSIKLSLAIFYINYTKIYGFDEFSILTFNNFLNIFFDFLTLDSPSSINNNLISDILRTILNALNIPNLRQIIVNRLKEIYNEIQQLTYSFDESISQASMDLLNSLNNFY